MCASCKLVSEYPALVNGKERIIKVYSAARASEVEEWGQQLEEERQQMSRRIEEED